jgi:hypothetical protein
MAKQPLESGSRRAGAEARKRDQDAEQNAARRGSLVLIQASIGF